jgi:hypothetical protein
MPALLTIAGLVLAAIANRNDSTPLRVVAAALILVAIMMFSFARLRGVRIGAPNVTLRMSSEEPTMIQDPGVKEIVITAMGRGVDDVEDQIREKLDQAGVHLTDEQIHEAIEHGSVLSASSSVVVGKAGASGNSLTINGKTIDTEAILATGTEATATIESVIQSPKPPAAGSSAGSMEILVLQVSRPGEEPHRATTPNVVPDERRHLLYPGATLPVKVSRDDPDLVAVDWQRVT